MGGNFAKARAFLERALAIAENLGPENTSMATCLSNLAGFLQSHGAPNSVAGDPPAEFLRHSSRRGDLPSDEPDYHVEESSLVQAKKFRECDPAHTVSTEQGRIFEQGCLPATGRRHALWRAEC